MKTAHFLFSIAAILVLVLFGLDTHAAETLHIGYTNAQGTRIPVFIAKEQRIFDKHGLDVRLTRVAPGRAAVPRLISGELQFFLGNSQPVIEAIAVEKAPLAIIASLGRERFAIYTKPEITRVEELKGRRFGVSTPGASQDSIATRALEKLGLTPEKDVRIVATGLSVSADRLLSLARGDVDAVAATADDVLQLGPEYTAKIRKLVDLSELGILISGADVSVGKIYLRAQRGTVRRFLQALDEALELARQRPDIVAAAYEKYAGVSDSRTLAQRVKEYYASHPPEHPYPDKPAIASALEELKKKLPELNADDPAAYIDDSLYL
ncbi:MAG TPA: ABC transporter substrate-binding protein [Verrucomicrobiae bacterium]|jgi:NitT/TauT family transport system substrate-binding protein|nr:ABC transporter substrate-binding protein [Verrucomicrobiae bacterium]